jgi:hypothetical protein
VSEGKAAELEKEILHIYNFPLNNRTNGAQLNVCMPTGPEPQLGKIIIDWLRDEDGNVHPFYLSSIGTYPGNRKVYLEQVSIEKRKKKEIKAWEKRKEEEIAAHKKQPKEKKEGT